MVTACSFQTSSDPSQQRPLPKQREIIPVPINTHARTPSLRASGEGSQMLELHLPRAKEHETVISTMETVSVIPHCANMTGGRPNTVESLQGFLMKFSFAITDKGSCLLHRMRNLLFEMILELEVGNSSKAWGRVVMVLSFFSFCRSSLENHLCVFSTSPWPVSSCPSLSTQLSLSL